MEGAGLIMLNRLLLLPIALVVWGHDMACGHGETVLSEVVSEQAALTHQTLSESTSYVAALKAARQQAGMLLVSIEPEPATTATDPVACYLARADVRSRFATSSTPWVFCRLGMEDGGTQLLASSALRELRQGPGVFVVDQAHDEWLGRVVSVLPRTAGKYYQFSLDDLGLLADLPAGSLTQRSMILAVRRHHEAPQSTCGRCDRRLAEAAAAHSAHQARLQVQGHHGWATRSRQLATSGGASEVCAESWPDQDLLDSCVDCVACWRQSSGHWQAVSGRQTAFGYDIRRSSNSIWYATGIFIR